MYRVELQGSAFEDMQKAWTWYDEISEHLGERFKAELRACFIKLAQNPQRNPVKLSGNYRFANLNKFPFIVGYQIDDSTNKVIVATITHTKRASKSL